MAVCYAKLHRKLNMVDSDIIQMLKRNKDIFADKDTELCYTDTVTKTGNQPPIRNRPYRVLLTEKVNDMAVDDMLGAKNIQRSQSLWFFPVVVVLKGDGSDRNFRSLNRLIMPSQMYLPLVDNTLSLLGKKVFLYFRSQKWILAG